MVDSEPPSMKVEEAEALNWVWLGQVEAQRVPEWGEKEEGERGERRRKLVTAGIGEGGGRDALVTSRVTLPVSNTV